jgi:uncharacterized protein YqfA (UPF0365 family)
MNVAGPEFAQRLSIADLMTTLAISDWQLAVLAIGVLAVLVIAALGGQLFNLYLQALFSDVKVTMIDLIGMRLRKVDARIVVYSRIRAVKSGLDLSTEQLEAHYLAGGHVMEVVTAMISGQRAQLPLTWDQATVIDLAGYDVAEAVNTAVCPKVVEFPAADGSVPAIDAATQDGTRLVVSARVFVRTRLERLVGGTKLETIVDRVSRAIVTTINSAHRHDEVLENPAGVGEAVMGMGLDQGAAFEILAVEIDDIKVWNGSGAPPRNRSGQVTSKRSRMP